MMAVKTKSKAKTVSALLTTVRVLARTWPQSAYLKNFPKPKDPDPNAVRPADANTAPLQTAPLIPDLPESLRQNPDTGGGDSGREIGRASCRERV